MRPRPSNSPRALGPALSTIPLAVVWTVACGGNVSSAPADAAPDERRSEDAAIVLPSPDAASPDATASERDSGQTDAGHATDATDDSIEDAGARVTITVIGPAGLEPNVPIVADDANGFYLATYSTGPSGTFEGTLPPSSTVTVDLGTPSYYSLQTIVGVELGDTIDFVDPASSPAENLTVTSVPTPSPTGTTGYRLTVGYCSEAFQVTPWPYSAESGCASAQVSGGRVQYTAPLLLQAVDENDDPLAFVSQKDFSIPAEGDGGTVSVAPAGPWQPPLVVVPQVGSPPSGMWASSIGEVVGGALIGGGVQWVSTSVIPPSDAGPGDGGAPQGYPVQPGFADSLQAEAMWTSSMSGDVVVTAVTNAPVPSSSPASLAIDASSIATFPEVTGVAATVGASGSLRIAWSEGALDAVTGVVGVASWLSADEQSGGTWTILSPATTGSFLQAPALGPHASWGPQTGAILSSSWLYAVQGTAFPTYQTVRQSPSFFTVSFAPTTFGCLGAFITDLVGPTIPPIPAGTSLTIGVYGEPALPFGCD